MRNEQVFQQLPAGTRTAGVSAYLRGEDGAILYSFLYGPEGLAYGRKAKYAKAETAQTSVQAYQYLGTDGRALKLDNLLLEGGNSRSVRPLIEGLEKLTVSDIANGRYSPPVVFFSWGSQVFGPAVLLEGISWEEISWLGGEPQEARVSFTLQEIPASQDPNAQATIEPILPEQTQATNTLYQAAQRAINQATTSEVGSQQIQPTALTDRQRSDGVSRAEDWLRQNFSILPNEARRFYSSNKYQLNASSVGDVTFANSRGTYALDIGGYDGRVFNPSL